MSASDDGVGYGKPPKRTRFKPGQSGNPNGRPKGGKNLKTDLVEELSERVPVTENGRPLKISKQRLMVKALIAKAVKGDTRAAGILISLLAQTIGLDAQEGAKVDLSAEDDAILASWMARVKGSANG
jgi:Family of unknown function (DUF5681)